MSWSHRAFLLATTLIVPCVTSAQETNPTCDWCGQRFGSGPALKNHVGATHVKRSGPSKTTTQKQQQSYDPFAGLANALEGFKPPRPSAEEIRRFRKLHAQNLRRLQQSARQAEELSRESAVLLWQMDKLEALQVQLMDAINGYLADDPELQRLARELLAYLDRHSVDIPLGEPNTSGRLGPLEAPAPELEETVDLSDPGVPILDEGSGVPKILSGGDFAKPMELPKVPKISQKTNDWWEENSKWARDHPIQAKLRYYENDALAGAVASVINVRQAAQGAWLIVGGEYKRGAYLIAMDAATGFLPGAAGKAATRGLGKTLGAVKVGAEGVRQSWQWRRGAVRAIQTESVISEAQKWYKRGEAGHNAAKSLSGN